MQHDGDARGCRRRRRCRSSRAQRVEIERRAATVAVGGDALVDLDHPLVQQLGQHDVAVEDARPVLVGDAQRVAEAAGDRPAAVRSPLRSSSALVATVVPILTASTSLGRDRLAGAEAEQRADAGDRGVAVAAPGSPTAACG